MENDSQARRTEEPQDRWLWIIQELFLDVFSRFGTGVIFLFLASLALAEPAYVWIQQPDGVGSKIYDFIKLAAQPQIDKTRIPLIDNTPISVFSGLIVFVLAYLVGLIFSRLDIKTPDRISFQRRAKCLWWDYLRDKDKAEVEKGGDGGRPPVEVDKTCTKKLRRIRRALSRLWKIFWGYVISMKVFDDFPQHEDCMDKGKHIKNLLIKELICSCKTDCEFPYHYLKMYLKTRGYDCLADMVPWEADQEGSSKDSKRSRNFITILKFRIRYYGGARVMNIVRNEAIVRLLSSAWWAARVIIWISIASMLILFIHRYNTWNFYVLPTLTFIIAALLRWGVTNQLHDLRMREIFQVLATAWTMKRDHPEWFEDIPKFNNNPREDH